MKKLYAILILTVSMAAIAGPNEVRVTQRLADDSAFIGRDLAVPAGGADGLFRFNGTTSLPGYVTLGTNLSITSGVLNAAAGVPQVSSDWNAVTGVSAIQNKPTISTVGMTGQYGDLLDKPTIPVLTAFNFGAPGVRSLTTATAYQATDSGKAAIVTISPQCTNATTVLAASACTLQVRQGSAGLTCGTGTIVSTWSSTYALGLLLTNTSGSPIDVKLPTGGYFILCATAGTFGTVAAVDQSAG